MDKPTTGTELARIGVRADGTPAVKVIADEGYVASADQRLVERLGRAAALAGRSVDVHPAPRRTAITQVVTPEGVRQARAVGLPGAAIALRQPSDVRRAYTHIPQARALAAPQRPVNPWRKVVWAVACLAAATAVAAVGAVRADGALLSEASAAVAGALALLLAASGMHDRYSQRSGRAARTVTSGDERGRVR